MKKATNETATILRLIGILLIITGAIVGLVAWAMIDSYGFAVNLAIFISAFISGMLFIGFAEIIVLLQSCYNKLGVITGDMTNEKEEETNENTAVSLVEKNEEGCEESINPIERKTTKVKIIFENNISDKDFYIDISGVKVHSGKGYKGEKIECSCFVGENSICLCNEYYKIEPVKFKAYENKSITIVVRSTLSGYKVVSIV